MKAPRGLDKALFQKLTAGEWIERPSPASSRPVCQRQSTTFHTPAEVLPDKKPADCEHASATEIAPTCAALTRSIGV